jgi:16S rRNA (guanine966-N2)-methyltransferase
VRIIAGALKGRRLTAPRWPGLRPTSDKLRETLFNIVQHRIAGAAVLDGFAGTGALGLEALSRGAGHVTFVERDRRAAALIADHASRFGVLDRCAIIRADVMIAVPRDLPRAYYDLVLLDPPYDAPTAGVADAVARAGDRLDRGGLLILEHARRRDPPAAAGRLARTRTVTSGDSALAFYE